MSKKVSLGTKWAFQEIEDPSGKMAPLYGVEADGTTYRIMPSRNVSGEWNLDVHKRLTGWEDAVSGKTFKTPEAAAKVLIKMHAETQSKDSEKNIKAQLRAMRPGFYEARNMSDMGKILEAAEAEVMGTLDETVGASIVDRMAMAMLEAPKLEVLATRVFDDESQRQMFDGMITEPLRALIAKALDAAGATVSGGLLAKAGREIKGVARGGMGEAVLSELGGQRGSRGRDPYWMTAKYAGKAKDGTPFKKGDKVFYYPSTKTVLAGDDADKAASEFQGAADDERLYNQGSEW